MDTGTHFVMGIGLFGLAHIDPEVLSHSSTAQAVLVGTVLGSQIPDIDVLYRLKGNSSYIKNHRGWSHSLPMLVIWPTLLSFMIDFFLPQANWLHLWLWTFLGVLIHVGIDIFNTYGTQALRPISNRWISLNVINIFDSFIFSSHIIGFGLWILYPDSIGWIFVTIYLAIILYIIVRYGIHAKIEDRVNQEVKNTGKVTIIPTFRQGVWNVIWECENNVQIGEIKNKTIQWRGKLSTEPLKHPATIKSQQSEAVSSFLSFTNYGYPQVFSHPFGYEVRWLDVRYHHKKRFPFIAVSLLDPNHEILDSFVGWMSEDQLKKKIRHLI